MKKELDTLKSKYAQSIVFAYKNRSNYQYINFLFSATNFNDALKRMAYLKSYRQQRQVQVETILKTQQVLQVKIGTLAASKQEQSKTLQSHKVELQDLEEDKKAKDQVVKQIKSQEKEIAAQLKKKNKQRQDIRNAIAVIIKKERDLAIAKKKEEDRLARLKAEEDKKKAAGSKPGNTDVAVKTPKTSSEGSATTGVTKVDRSSSASEHVLESTPEDKRLSLNFATNKGRLPWPVAGRIMIPFGPYNLGGLVGNCDGVEIAIAQGTPVKSVADGVVEAIFDAGGEQTVMVRHGKYFTTYSYLASVSVSKGQEVNAGSVIGKAGTNDEGEGWLSFMITNEKSVFLNPQSWLK
jgi:septal ring factor EnvC (AmiA/AmiB activator)